MHYPAPLGALALSAALGCSIALAPATACAADVAGVHLEERLALAPQPLVLNGAGLRTRFFIQVYVAALYVPQKTRQPEAIIANAGPRSLKLRLLREMDADTLLGALEDGLRQNLSEAELASLRPAREQFGALVRQVGKAREGDELSLDFAPEGVSLGLNGTPRGQVADAALGPALLRIWLGARPVDAGLKKALLGG
ncbi:MAG: chalcone isomerase family protein [Zoogloea sp.]|uniref:chalcone isomerase family protein n=1 Tax=Zoogloea sp. TaxID=49181 RepID=UPI003F3A142C